MSYSQHPAKQHKKQQSIKSTRFLCEKRRQVLSELREKMEIALVSQTGNFILPADLEKQLDALNSVFMRLLANADTDQDMFEHYVLALKAQNQFRKTLQITETLKESIIKNDKRTEIK